MCGADKQEKYDWKTHEWIYLIIEEMLTKISSFVVLKLMGYIDNQCWSETKIM